jgi:hypothetical protein
MRQGDAKPAAMAATLRVILQRLRLTEMPDNLLQRADESFQSLLRV